MTTVTTNRAFLENNLPAIGRGLTVEEITVVDNASVNFLYSNQRDGDSNLIDLLFGGASLSVSEGTFAINRDGLSGDGSVNIVSREDLFGTFNVEGSITVSDGETTLGGGLIPTNELTLNSVDGSGLDGAIIASGGDISTAGGSQTAGGTSVAPPPAAAALGEEDVTLAISPDFFRSLGAFEIDVIGEDLFSDGLSGTVTELRISTGNCEICGEVSVHLDGDFVVDPSPPLLMVFSDLDLAFSDVFQFLESTDQFLSGGLQSAIFEGDDRITGSDDADQIAGLGGDDTLEGGDGDDVFLAGEGADLFDGGDGFDFVTYADADGRVFVDMLSSARTGGEALGDRFVEVEGLTGGRFGDHLRGDRQDNILQGGNASDRLLGRNGDDTLEGGLGNDALYGGAGVDIMSGGEGTDRFIYFSHRNSRVGEGNRDIITDFSVEDNDRIELTRLDGDVTQTFNQSFQFIGDAEFSAIGQIRFDQSSGVSTIVQADRTGDGIADFEIELIGLHDLTEVNFLL